MGFRYVVRQAKPEDCGDILRLIKELAEYEGENPDLVVKNTEQGLRNDSFGDHAFFHCLVGEAVDEEEPTVKGTTVAYAMYFCAYSTWIGRLLYLEDLFIQPSHRGKGLGKAMVCKVAQIGAEKGCKGMQWVVQESNASARQFYDRLNAVDMTEKDGWRVIGSRGENFTSLANSLKNPDSNNNNIRFLC